MYRGTGANERIKFVSCHIFPVNYEHHERNTVLSFYYDEPAHLIPRKKLLAIMNEIKYWM